MPILNKQIHLNALARELADASSEMQAMLDAGEANAAPIIAQAEAEDDPDIAAELYHDAARATMGPYGQVASALSAPVSRRVPGPVAPATIANVLLERGKWQAVDEAADSAEVPGRAARSLTRILQSPHVEELAASSGELKRLVNVLVAGEVLDEDDKAALHQASRVEVADPSRGQELGIGRIYWQFVWQVRNPGARIPWAAKFDGPGSALAFTNANAAVIATQTIASAAEALSAEQVLLANTIVPGIRYYFTVTGFASAPTGTMLARIQPYYSSGGTAFDSFLYTTPFTVDADAQFDFTGWVPNQIARWFKFGITNNTDVNTDASAVSAWLWYQEITA